MASTLRDLTPALSINVRNFSAEDPSGWDHLVELAVTADRAGIDRLTVSDHIAFGENLDAYGDPRSGGMAGGTQPTGPDGHWLEPLTTLTFLAGLTSHARLATGILIAALRRPAVLAKQAATLDVLSGGRLDLGVGVGWQREEYEVAGLAYEGRGRLLDHTLEVCQTLWLEPVADFDSGGLAFERIHSMPKPLQPGGVPVWVSGRLNDNVLRRIVRFGSGWIPWGDEARDPAAVLGRVHDALRAAGRDVEGFQVQGPLPVKTGPDGSIDVGATMAAVPSLVDAGVTDFRVNVRVPDGRDAGDVFAELVTAFRTTVGRPLP